MIGLTAHALIAVLARAFYAHQDTATPVVAAVVAVVVNVVVAVALVGPLGVVGLALAIAAGAWVETVMLAVLLRRRIPGLGLGEVARVMVVTAIVVGLRSGGGVCGAAAPRAACGARSRRTCRCSSASSWPPWPGAS